MKQKFLFLVFAGLLLAACSENVTDPTVTPKGEKELVFQFPGITSGHVVPYTRADEIATDDENKLATLDIYVFKGTDDNAILERIYHSGEGIDSESTIKMTQTGEVETAKISVPTADDNKAKIFFFVGNGRSIISLNTAKEGTTKLGDFKDFKVNALRPSTHIVPPLLMTQVHTVADISGLSGAQEIKLARRMARFDVRNVSRDSNFAIDEILITGARPSTRIFTNASAPDDTPTIAMDAINFAALTGANAGPVLSVFYIYPTLNDADSDEPSETELTLVGHVNGTSTLQIYPVKFAVPTAADPEVLEHLKIDANHRYIIDVQKAGVSELEATLRVEEWLDGTGVSTPVDPGTIRVLDENGQVIADNIVTVDATGKALNLKVEATSKWIVDEIPDTVDWVKVTGADATDVGTDFTVTIEPNTDNEPRSYIIFVRNAVEKSILQPIIIQQEGA